MFGNYYVYTHHDSDGEIFYVGKGTRKRAWLASTRSKEWEDVARDGYSVNIMFDGLSNYIAEKIEQITILHIGIDNLVNKTLGGGGAFGYKHSKEWKDAARDRMIGTGNPMFGMTAHNRGTFHTRASIEKMSGPRESISGINNPSADRSEYKFRSMGGDEFIGNRTDFIKHSGLNRSDVSKIVTKSRPQSKGWYLADG